MKTLSKLLCVVFLAGYTSVQAQEYSQELPKGTGLTVKFDNVVADMVIQGKPGNKLIIRAEGLAPPPEKAEGLRALKRTGMDNTGLALSVVEYEDMVIVSGGSSDQKLAYSIELPAGANLVVVNNWFNHEKELTILGISGEVEVSCMGGKVDMRDVTGPVVAKVDNGELNIVFKELKQDSPMSLISSNGDIDVTLPAASRATFKLAAREGEIYTDLDLVKLKEEIPGPETRDLKVYSSREGKFVTVPYRVLSEDLTLAEQYTVRPSIRISTGRMLPPYTGKWISTDFFWTYDYKGTLNGGGVEISVRSQNGNVYLRKSKK